jgi:hypothetical protein
VTVTKASVAHADYVLQGLAPGDTTTSFTLEFQNPISLAEITSVAVSGTTCSGP